MNIILSFFAKILIFLHIITPVSVPIVTPSAIPTPIPVVSQQPTPTPQVIPRVIYVTPKPIITPKPTPTPCVIGEEERYALEVIEILKIRPLTSYEQTKLNGTYRDIIIRNDPVEVQNLIKQLSC